MQIQLSLFSNPPGVPNFEKGDFSSSMEMQLMTHAYPSSEKAPTYLYCGSILTLPMLSIKPNKPLTCIRYKRESLLLQDNNVSTTNKSERYDLFICLFFGLSKIKAKYTT